MTAMIFSIPHPVEGSVDILGEDTDILIKVRWPFDLASDEWVEMIGCFRREDFDRAVVATMEQPGQHVIDHGDDRLVLDRVGDHFVFDLSRGGSMPKRLTLEFSVEHLRDLRAIIAGATRK